MIFAISASRVMETVKTLNPTRSLTASGRARPAPEQAQIAEAAPDAVQRKRFVAAVVRKLYRNDPEFACFGEHVSTRSGADLYDFVFAVDDEPHLPDDVFGRLRWGGQFVYVSGDREKVESLPERFRQRGFEVLHGPLPLRMGWRIPFWSQQVWCFAARKVFLIRPREISDRFTYHVQLVRREPTQPLPPPEFADPLADYVVLKEIPSLERVIGRLRARFTDLPHAVIERRARNFTEKIFPLFLTREAAMLKVLERDLPAEYVGRFPRCLAVEKDSRGYVQRLWMNWLRNAGQPLTQIEFAKQFAELLQVLHDRVGIVHLDLRLDNIVITEKGVGFVDFGSAVRLGENITGNTLLSTLFEELMRTSQIQKMLERMTKSGSVTSKIIREAYGKVDRAVDLFYLAVQMSNPVGNPDLRGLIRLYTGGREAAALARLRREILMPQDPNHPAFRNAGDILDAIRRLQAELNDPTTTES